MASSDNGFNLTISYFLGQYLLKEENYTGESNLFTSLTLLDINKTWYVYNDFSLAVNDCTHWVDYATEVDGQTDTYTLSLYADPNEGLNSSISSMYMANVGNIVSPNGAAIIFGAETNEENATDLTVANEETYNPYNIIIVEEDTDESIPAEQITFSPDPGSALTGETVQTAINELEQVVYNSVPVFTQEAIELAPGMSYCSPTKTFSTTAMMVYYNGLLINEGIHYTITGNTINFLDFTFEEGDIITIIGLASSGGSASSATIASAIGGSY